MKLKDLSKKDLLSYIWYDILGISKDAVNECPWQFYEFEIGG